MELKQLQQTKRTIFLKLFTKELIKAISEKDRIKEKIKIEKLKQKFIEPPISAEQAISQTINTQAFQPSKYQIKEIEKHPKTTPPRTKPPRTIILQRPLPKPFIKRIKKKIRRQQIQNLPPQKPQAEALAEIQPQYQPRPQEFNLGKIETFLKDPLLQSIECQGPGKTILIKRYNQINSTRITLSQQEINQIINDFSKQAKIPTTGGILKAAVGNLVISAVISEFVGSRFIITKINPQPRIPSQIQINPTIKQLPKLPN